MRAALSICIVGSSLVVAFFLSCQPAPLEGAFVAEHLGKPYCKLFPKHSTQIGFDEEWEFRNIGESQNQTVFVEFQKGKVVRALERGHTITLITGRPEDVHRHKEAGLAIADIGVVEVKTLSPGEFAHKYMR
jgi:hypothetical protein